MVPRGADCVLFAAQGAASGAKRLASEGYDSAPDCTENPKNEDAGTPDQVGRYGVNSRHSQAERGGFSAGCFCKSLRDKRMRLIALC